MEMLTVQKCIPMWQKSFEGKYYKQYFYDKSFIFRLLFLDLNIYMYVGAHVSRFKYFNINFVFKILFLISVDCIFRANVAAVIFVLNQKQGSLSLSLSCAQQPLLPPLPSSSKKPKYSKSFRAEWNQGQNLFLPMHFPAEAFGGCGAKVLVKATSQRHQNRRTNLPISI